MSEQELAEITDLVSLDIKKFQKRIEHDSLSNLTMRLHSIRRYKDRMPMQPLETPEDRLKKKEKLDQIITTLQFEIRKKELEQKQQHDKEEKEFSEKTAKKHVHVNKDVRICSDPIITRMESLGTEHVPPHSAQWTTPTSTKIDVPCQSKRVRTLDLEKLPHSLWKQLEQNKMCPVFLIAEPSGMIDGKGNPVPLWSNQKDYDVVCKQRQVSATVVALMVV